MSVGLDVHKNYLQGAAVDDRGILLKEQRIPDDEPDSNVTRFYNRLMKKKGKAKASVAA
jgi:predicted NBD/HSP70 family sugar kinase